MCMFWHEMKATVDCWIGKAAEQHVSHNPFLYKNKIKKSIYPFVVSQINVWKDKHQTIHIHHREIVKERSFQFLSLNSLLFEIFTTSMYCFVINRKKKVDPSSSCLLLPSRCCFFQRPP